MKLEQSFDVGAPLEQVWEALIDVERVAPCLPGAAITGRNDDGSYNGTFTIKIGPTTAAYTGKLEMEEVDEQAHTATLRAQGSDKRGQGGAKATISSKVTFAGDGRTRVDVDTDYSITGRLARFGRGGMIEDISERLLKEFATRLQASLAQQPEGGSGAAEEVAEGLGGGAGENGGAPAASTDEPPPVEVGAAPTEAPQPAEDGGVAPNGGATPPVADAELLDAASLVGGAMLDRIKRNPAPWVGAVVLLLLLRVLRRR